MAEKIIVTAAGILLILAVDWYFLVPRFRKPQKMKRSVPHARK